MTEELARMLLHLWQGVYRRAPVVTVVLTVMTFAALGTGIYFANKADREAQEVKRLENKNYANQIDSLNQIRSSLQGLIQFVDSQREQLKQSETALASVKNEHDKLKPLVEADRRIIDALFAAQEARNKEAQSRERWVGFGLGLIASLIASFLWALAYALIRRRKNQ